MILAVNSAQCVGVCVRSLAVPMTVSRSPSHRHETLSAFSALVNTKLVHMLSRTLIHHLALPCADNPTGRQARAWALFLSPWGGVGLCVGMWQGTCVTVRVCVSRPMGDFSHRSQMSLSSLHRGWNSYRCLSAFCVLDVRWFLSHLRSPQGAEKIWQRVETKHGTDCVCVLLIKKAPSPHK